MWYCSNNYMPIKNGWYIAIKKPKKYSICCTCGEEMKPSRFPSCTKCYELFKNGNIYNSCIICNYIFDKPSIYGSCYKCYSKLEKENVRRESKNFL